MNTRTRLALAGILVATAMGISACHVDVSCDAHRDNSGQCTVTVPPGGLPVTVVTSTTAPATSTTAAPTTTTTTAPPTTSTSATPGGSGV